MDRLRHQLGLVRLSSPDGSIDLKVDFMAFLDFSYDFSESLADVVSTYLPDSKRVHLESVSEGAGERISVPR